MRKVVSILLCLNLFLLASCSGGRSKGSASAPEGKDFPELMVTLPSDALAVVSGSRLSRVLALLDSTHVLQRPEYGKAVRNRAALALCYDGSLSSVLAIELNSRPEDSLDAVTLISESARKSGLKAAYFSAGQLASSKGALVLTDSDAQMSAVRRHIQQGSSILNARGFTASLPEDGSEDFLVLRTSGAARYLPKDFASGAFSRREASSFVSTLCDWICASPLGTPNIDIRYTDNGSDSYFSSLGERLQAGKSRLSDILPEATTLAIRISMEGGCFRPAYELYLDGNTKKNKYKDNLTSLKRQTGKNPLDWEKELDLRELATIRWDGKTVTALRSGNKTSDSPVLENTRPGFLAALYGKAFAPKTDSHTACFRGWHFYGSSEDIEALIEALKEDGQRPVLPSASSKLLVYRPGNILVWTKKGIKLWNSNQ